LRYPRRFAAALLKQANRVAHPTESDELSAAIRRGLIEAGPRMRPARSDTGYPRRFAAALLKLLVGLVRAVELFRYPRRFAAALLKLARRGHDDHLVVVLSAAIRRGLIEAWVTYRSGYRMCSVIRGDSPRPY